MEFLRNILIVIVLLPFWQCSTEVDLGGPYEEVAIVYGLLDLTEEEHVFRINKAFKGEGNVFYVAQVADSSQFNSLDARVEEWVNNEVERTWELERFKVDGKEEGDFYNKDVVMYRFFEDELNDDAIYRLGVEVNGKTLTAETKLVDDFRILPPLSFPSAEIVFAANSSGDGSAKYTNFKIEWESSSNGSRYDLNLVFSYMEFHTDGDSLKKEIDLSLGTSYPSITGVGEKLAISLGGEQFYKLLADRIEETESVVRRVPLGLDFKFLVAGKDLNTYIEVNKPSNDIIESKPEFSNITNGYGVFSF